MYTVDIFPDFAVLKEQSNQIFDLQFFVTVLCSNSEVVFQTMLATASHQKDS